MLTYGLMVLAPCLGGPGGPTFAPPVRIEAAGTPIDVTTGHAAPYVYDFDGDGVRDLLVGDFGSSWRKIHDRTPEEQAEYDALEAKNEELGDQAMPLWNARDPLTAEQQATMDRLDGEMRKNYDRMEEMRTHDRSSHGWVWLYRQVPSASSGSSAQVQ